MDFFLVLSRSPFTSFQYAFMAAIGAMLVSLIIYMANKKRFPDPATKLETSKGTATVNKEAIKCIKEMHPEPCLMELNVNRNNKALQFYEYMGMRKLREGDFPIGNGYYMNDYIMGLDI